MKFILSVEGNRLIAKNIKTDLEQQIDDTIIITAATLEEAANLLSSGTYNFQLALLDLDLSDAPNGEIVDLVASYDVPIFVFSAMMEDDLHKKVFSKSVIDYVLKDSRSSVTTLVKMVNRYFRNAAIKILYVDESKTAQQLATNMLKQYNFDTIVASDGYEALNILSDNLDISLVITDFYMPKMDGITLTKEIRRLHPDWNIGIIGILAKNEQSISSKFLKSGGNDFMYKDFHREEFFCRIHQNLNLIDHVNELHNIAAHDFLTNLPNRRTFFTLGEKLLENAIRQEFGAVVAVMDIDFFKNINDTWGHTMGDKVLKAVANKLSNRCRSADMIARISSEEFAFVGLDINATQAHKTLDAFRNSVENITISESGEEIKPTISIGFAVLDISNTFGENFDSLMRFADEALHEAKNTGRNRVKKYSAPENAEYRMVK